MQPLTNKEVRAIQRRPKSAEKMRDLVLFSLVIESSLGACDLVQLRVRDISKAKKVATHVKIMQTKTQHPIEFDISDETQELVATFIEQHNLRPSDYLFTSRLHESPHLLTRQYARAVASWVSTIGLDPTEYGTQSLRRTKPMLVFAKTKNVKIVQLLMGYVMRRNAKRLLGI